MTDRWLIVFPNWVGDAVMAHAFVRALQAANPTVMLDALVPQYLVDLMRAMPEIQHVIPHTLKHGNINFSYQKQLADQCALRGYQRAYVLPNSWKSALVPFLARIPERHGWLGECRFGLLNRKHYHPKRIERMVDRFLALAEAAPGSWLPKLTVPAADVSKPDDGLDASRPLLVLCPGAAFGPAKSWKAEYFSQVADHYLAQGWQVKLLGGPQDKDIANQIARGTQKPGLWNAVGRGSLGDAIRVLSQATLVLTNDSGLMHISAALGRPLVAVYGASSPQFTPPLNEASRILTPHVLCHPCFKRTCPLEHHACMRSIRPEQVVSALDGLWQNITAGSVS